MEDVILNEADVTLCACSQVFLLGVMPQILSCESDGVVGEIYATQLDILCFGGKQTV